MQPISGFRTDSPVTAEQYKAIDEAVKYAARQNIVGRRLTRIYGPLGFGKQAVTFDKLTETNEANVQFAFRPDKEEAGIDLARTTNKIAFIDKAFRIPAQSLAANTQLDLLNAESAGYKVAVKENKIIIDGFAADGTNYDISGFYQSAGNTEGTAKDFGTAGLALDKAKLAAGVMRTDSIFPPYNWTLHPTQFNELFDVLASTAVLEVDVIRRVIQGELLETAALTAGTGLMTALPGRGYFDVAMGVDMTVELEQMGLWDGRDLYGVAYESLAPRVWESNAICTLTGI